jgi:hypothetical protein
MHGRWLTGLERAVVDGCPMAFRRGVLGAVEPLPGFPPHDFYDWLLSCQVEELGYDVGVLGIACDHISSNAAAARADRLSRILSPWIEAAEKRWCPCGDAWDGSWSSSSGTGILIRRPASLNRREFEELIMVFEDRRDGWLVGNTELMESEGPDE